MGPLLSIQEAAQRLGLSRHTLRAWVRERRIPHIRLGRRVLFDAENLDRYVLEHAIDMLKHR